MSARRFGPLLLAAVLLAAGCRDVSQRSPTSTIVVAVFASPNIPTPNDLALQAVPTLPISAQRDLLQSFVNQGGFPVDQAPTLSVPLRAYSWDPATKLYVASATLPMLDGSSVTPETVALFKVDVAPPVRIDLEAAQVQPAGSANLVPKADSTGSRRLAAGRYVFAVRGGASGLKTTDGLPIAADSSIALTIPNKDLSDPANQPPGGISPGDLAQLAALQATLWEPLAWGPLNQGGTLYWTPSPSASVTPAYTAVDAAFPHAEVASIAAFQIATSAGTVPLVDATSGQAPLPIDLLRTGANGTIANNPAFGPAAAGLTTLDGFSTTATILAPTSLPVAASTVPGAVFLYKLSAASPPVPTLVPELKANGPGTARYVVQPTPLIIPETRNIVAGLPCPPSTGGCSAAIGLQPAVPVQLSPTTLLPLPPLDENTSYAVVITSGVKDIAGQALVRPTIMTLLLEDKPVALSGTSLVGGVDDATATAIETMRGQLVPVLAAVPGGAAGVVLAYTFKTQSFKATSLSLSAATYGIEQGAGAAIFTPSAAIAITPPVVTTGVAFYDVTFSSVDPIDKTTGALRATLATDLSTPATVLTLLTDLHALVAVPSDVSAQPFCNGVSLPRCVPLVIFGHGLNGSKEQLYAVASSLAQKGFVAAAIDLPLHGSRNWCSQDSDCVATGGGTGTCTPFPGAAGQGDLVPPGECTGGSVPATANSRYFVSANFFRLRDAIRENLLDVGAMTLALARPPPSVWPPQPSQDPFATLLSGSGMVVNPAAVYYEGLSLGSIAGTSVLATNSRLSRGALSVGGGTMVDLFTNSPSYQSGLVPLFTGLLAGALQGRTFSFAMTDATSDQFDLGVAEAYLQITSVAKWIIDPAESLNYAVNVTTAPLPDPLAITPSLQLAKAFYGQIAQNDEVILSPFEFLLYDLASANQTYYTGAGATHSMLATQPLVQADAADFLAGTLPPATRNLP